MTSVDLDSLFQKFDKDAICRLEEEHGLGWKTAKFLTMCNPDLGMRYVMALDNEYEDGAYLATILDTPIQCLGLVAQYMIDEVEIPDRVVGVIGSQLNRFSEVDLLNAMNKQHVIVPNGRGPGKDKTIRMVDCMGICRRYLAGRTLQLYNYYRTSSRHRNLADFAEELPALAARVSGDIEDYLTIGQANIHQALSKIGNTQDLWMTALCNEVLTDYEFLRYLKKMLQAGVEQSRVASEIDRRMLYDAPPSKLAKIREILQEEWPNVAAKLQELETAISTMSKKTRDRISAIKRT